MFFKIKIHRPYVAVFILIHDTDIQAAIAHVIRKEDITAAEIISVKTVFTEKP